MTLLPLIQTLFPAFPYSQDEARRILAQAFRRLRFHIEGAANIPRDGPAILIMNHTGWEEVLLTIVSAPRPIKFVGIQEEIYLDQDASWERLFETVHFAGVSPRRRAAFRWVGRLLGEALRVQWLRFGYIPTQVPSALRGIPVGTNGFRQILRCLADGELLVFFPEGGLHRRGTMRPFRRGIGMLLRQAERLRIPVQVVPAAQHSAGSISWSLGTVYEPRLVYGAPLRLTAAGRPVAEPAAEFDRWATRHLQEQVHALMDKAWRGHALPPQTYADE